MVRDLEKNTAEANHLREQREKLEQDLQVHTQQIAWRKDLVANQI